MFNNQVYRTHAYLNVLEFIHDIYAISVAAVFSDEPDDAINKTKQKKRNE